jgi:uncharacterized protein
VTVPQRLTLVTIGVADVARATAFYQSLGWKKAAASQPSITFLVMAGSVLSLYGRDALAEDAQVSSEGDGFRAVTLACNLDSQAQVDDVFAQWLQAGATCIKTPQLVFWGGYSGYVADLDGHLWELAYNPGLVLSADGFPQMSVE